MALTYKSGTAGAVRSGSNVVIGGLTKWSIDKQLQMIATPSFSLTADANGVTWNQFVLTGLASATCLGTTENWTLGASENVTATVARNSQRTEYVYDTLSRPTTVRRAAGTPLQTVQTNTWHPDTNLPSKVIRGLSLILAICTTGAL